VVQNSDQVRFHRLAPDASLTIGSAPDNDIVLRVRGVSRRHAALRRDQQGFVLADLGSKNGLLCDGARVESAVLATNRPVQIGEALLTIEEVPTVDDEAAVGFSGAEWDSAEFRQRPTARVEPPPSPAAALLLVRQLEQALASGAEERVPSLFETARELLGAAALAAVSHQPGEDLVVHRLWGALSEDDAAALAAALTARAAGDSAPTPRILLTFDAGAHGEPTLAAVFPAARPPLTDWMADFLSFLGVKLLAPAEVPRPDADSDPPPGELYFPAGMVLGGSASMRGLLQQLRGTVRSDLDVLLLGETGTGKELVARTIHASGRTRKGPFVSVNCAAITGEQLEAELFGVEARAANGGGARVGLFVQADGGTILLDQVAELPERLQARLVRVLQEREVLPLGGASPQPIHVRVVSASHRDLALLVDQGSFRADLYYRLRGLQFHLPPLRDRREDIPELVLAFGTAAARKYNKRILGVSRRALALLMEHPWPGNVRELETEVERAVLLCPDGGLLESKYFGTIRWARDQRTGAVPPPLGGAPTSAAPPVPGQRTLQEQVDEVERRAILDALAASRGNRSRAARLLGITRNGLALKLKRLSIE
jgi:DNA-binding NtrC family response regulator